MTTLSAIQLSSAGIISLQEAQAVAMVDVLDKRNLDLLPALVESKIISVATARKALGLPPLPAPVSTNVDKPKTVEPVKVVAPAPTPKPVESKPEPTKAEVKPTEGKGTK